MFHFNYDKVRKLIEHHLHTIDRNQLIMKLPYYCFVDEDTLYAQPENCVSFFKDHWTVRPYPIFLPPNYFDQFI